MGYYENTCQLCAVSFNIARLRTKHEPESAAWGYSYGVSYSSDGDASLCTLVGSKSGCENIEIEGEEERLHIPGPGCCFDGGYSGSRIGVEEMEGMRFPRYIVAKPENVESFSNEEQTECEKESEFFVTTQTIEPPDEFDPGALAKVRFGIADFFAQNYNISYEESGAVPVHAACWEIFENVCQLRAGKTDLQGFMALWMREACANCGFHGIKQDSMIRRCKEQFWSHIPGTEYLAANPVDIPGFHVAIQAAYRAIPDGDLVFFGRKTGNFIGSKMRHNLHVNHTDVFMKIPIELRDMILAELRSTDIAALRLVSRAFRQLSKRLFRGLIKKELPWFWELEDIEQRNSEHWTSQRASSASLTGGSSLNVNWKTVYENLKTLEKSFLGIRNRVRVWNVAEEVVRRIQTLRTERDCPIDGVELLSLEPTDEDESTGRMMTNYDCPRCSFHQRERTQD